MNPPKSSCQKRSHSSIMSEARKNYVGQQMSKNKFHPFRKRKGGALQLASMAISCAGKSRGFWVKITLGNLFNFSQLKIPHL